jgi:hypothetical protein
MGWLIGFIGAGLFLGGVALFAFLMVWLFTILCND